MENGFSTPRSESFPVGLRVLVVDDDPTWLKILEKMLKKCSYEGTSPLAFATVNCLSAVKIFSALLLLWNFVVPNNILVNYELGFADYVLILSVMASGYV